MSKYVYVLVERISSDNFGNESTMTTILKCFDNEESGIKTAKVYSIQAVDAAMGDRDIWTNTQKSINKHIFRNIKDEVKSVNYIPGETDDSENIIYCISYTIEDKLFRMVIEHLLYKFPIEQTFRFYTPLNRVELRKE